MSGTPMNDAVPVDLRRAADPIDATSDQPSGERAHYVASPGAQAVPKVSLGLPVYNGSNYLEPALKSILGQTFEDFELIISDNASTDSTADICKSYAEQDPRIRYFRQSENIGAAANYNFVFHQARGDYFKWCAHDDLIGSTFLEACAAWLDTHDDYVGSFPKDVSFIDEQDGFLGTVDVNLNPGDLSPGKRFAHYIDMGFIHCGVFFGLYRRKALDGSGLHGAFIASDRVFIGEMLLRGRIAQVEGTKMFFRRHPEQYSRRELHDQSDAIVWLDPNQKDTRIMRRRRYVSENIKAIKRSPIPQHERLVALQAVARLAWSERSGLFKELMLPLYRNGRPTEAGRSLLRLFRSER